MIYNLTMVMLHVRTQGDVLLEIMEASKSPISYAIAAMIAAPLGEELVFRGFLFQGLRQQYGWNRAALFSSAVFAGMHLQLVALIPTFLLGYALAWVYNKANSIWPGIILHCLVNSLAMCIVLTVMMFPSTSLH
jgi:membrane protease YdiL (CAAX protease family)